jgi:cell division topological specificity factor
MGLLSRLFRGNHKNSKTIAKERLRLVLAHDRSGIPPELLNVMKDDIITVISKHVRVDHDAAQVNLTQTRGDTRLVADIPIASLRPGAAPRPNDRNAR